MMIYKRKGLLFTIIIISVSLIIGFQAFILFQNAEKTIITEIGNNAKNTAASVAIFLEADIDNYKSLMGDDGKYNEEYYNEMLLVFQNLKESTGADYIYTAKYISEDEMEYILDAEKPESEDFSAIGSKDIMAELQLDAFKDGLITASDIVYQEGWGYFLTGYAPIKDKDGSVIGLVNVDISLEKTHEIITQVTTILVIVSVILSIILSLFIYMLFHQRHLTKSFDYLTKLYSRSYFEITLSRLIKQRKKEYKALSLLMIDIDHFKTINDQYGHNCGDIALKAVGQVLKQCTRNEDTCARFGGDEFAVILPEVGKEDAIKVCERLLNTIRELQITGDNEETFNLTLSIGMAEWSKGMTSTNLVEAADNMLYISKNEGKDRYTV